MENLLQDNCGHLHGKLTLREETVQENCEVGIQVMCRAGKYRDIFENIEKIRFFPYFLWKCYFAGHIVG